MDRRERGGQRGERKGREEERTKAVINLLYYSVSEKKILERYSEDDLTAAKERLRESP